MEDLRDILPHSKKDVKLDVKDKLSIVNEVFPLRDKQCSPPGCRDEKLQQRSVLRSSEEEGSLHVGGTMPARALHEVRC